MARYSDNVVDQNGAPIQGATVYVYTQDSDLAELTEDGGGDLANPVTTDSYGNFHFNAADGLYDLVYHYGGRQIYRFDGAMVGTGPVLPEDILATLIAPGMAALIGKSGSGTIQDFIDDLGLISGGLAGSVASGNMIIGSPGAGGSLTPGQVAGAHNADTNTGYGIGVFTDATTAYASSGFGYGTLGNVTSGHSNTAVGYQAGISLTTGIMNTLIGVDAGLFWTAASHCTILGHHCGNSGNFAGDGAVFIGQQTARSLTAGTDLTVIGHNAMANSPATGSSLSEVIGGAAAIATPVLRSQVIGGNIFAVGTGGITDSFLAGYQNHYGAASVSGVVSIGGNGFFRASGGGGNNNTGLGQDHGFSVAGANNVFIGYRAGYRSADTSVSGAVCIGNLAGFDSVTSNKLIIANSNGAGAVLIDGDFSTRAVNMYGQLSVDSSVKVKSYTVAGLPSAATAGAGAMLFASNARNGGEGAGVGTGSLVVSDGTNWKIPGIAGAVAA